MTTRQTFLRHHFQGGWATDFGPTADVVPDGTAVAVPFLVNADNVIFEFDLEITHPGDSNPDNNRISGYFLIYGDDIRVFY